MKRGFSDKEILSAALFQRFVQLERLRVDRGGRPFALIVFKADQPVSSRRLRALDLVGWYGREIGVLLPETTLEDAVLVAEEMTPGRETGSYRMVSYPPRGGTSPTEILEYVASPVPVWKLGLDKLCAGVGLVVLAPLFLLLGGYIKMVSPGPVFFRQIRVGRGGRQFCCYKFRTMRLKPDGDIHRDHTTRLIRTNAPMKKLDEADPRIIPGGGFMRKTGIDELPQLVNILRGEMSLVGPRPCIPYELDEYELWHAERLDPLPGLTGLWQVSGKNSLSFETMVRLDVSYAASISMLRDFRIVLKTFPAIAGFAIKGARA